MKTIEDVENKMIFLSDDRNMKLMTITSIYNTKSIEDFKIDNDLMLDQATMVIKLLNSPNKEIQKKSIELFYCPSPISGGSLNDVYNAIKNLLSTKTEKEVDEFIEYYYG